jgi:hypothetical protein
MNAAIAAIVVSLPLDAVTLDIELQPRAMLHTATWQEYLYLLGDGTALPPVVVFSDGEKHWLADGYHRWHAHKAFGSTEIAAVVRQGSREEALRFSLGANATHGKRREVGDYARSYATACKHGFVRPDDTVGVQAALACSMRCAYDLTAPARKKIEAEREAEIAARRQREKATGRSRKRRGYRIRRWLGRFRVVQNCRPRIRTTIRSRHRNRPARPNTAK